MRIHVGDCLTVLPTLPASSVDAIVTDPPYGLSFMGKDWDHGVPGTHFWTEMLRVAKPGAHLVAFGGTRTFHRMTCAIEDAGWQIRDCLSWVYGNGFPKGHNGPWGGTTLKPAWEPIVLARNPLCGGLATNFAAYATGGLNIDVCRIGNVSTVMPRPPKSFGRVNDGGWQPKPGTNGSHLGRWPSNLVLDQAAGALLDTQTGDRPTKRDDKPSYCAEDGQWGTLQGRRGPRGYTDNGGASRFFYCAKASRSERQAGGSNNEHPTVKPLSLMRWLCRLVTPANGIILDPFMGSGSTGCAAALEGMHFIGIEQDENYVAVAKSRIDHWAAMTPAQLALEFSDDEAAA